jgi:hypothetical protein
VDEISFSNIVELNYHTGFFNSNLLKFVNQLLKSLKKDIKEKGILHTIKSGISNFVDIVSDKLQGTRSDPDIQLIKL